MCWATKKFWAPLLFVFGTASVQASTPEETEAEAFVSQVNSEIMAVSRALFQDLTTCYEGLVSRGHRQVADRLVERFYSWDEYQFTSKEGITYDPIKLLNYLDLSEELPVSVPAFILQELQKAHDDFAEECSAVMVPRIGSAQFDVLYKKLWRKLKSSSWRLVLRGAVVGLNIAGIEGMEKVINLFPQSILSSVPFLKDAWFRRFAMKLLSDKMVQEHVSRVLAMDTETLDFKLRHVYRVVNPYRIHYMGLKDENQVYPFVVYFSHHPHWIFDEEVMACMETMGTLEVQYWEPVEGEKTFAFYKRFLSEIRKRCPSVSEKQARAMVTLEDRMSNWILPEAAKRALALKFPLAGGFDAIEANAPIVRSSQHTEKVYALLKPIEMFTAKLRTHFYPRSLNHVTAPGFLRSYFQLNGVDRVEMESIIFTVGLAYQIFDAQSKMQQKTISEDEIFKQAMDDLKLWNEAATNF